MMQVRDVQFLARAPASPRLTPPRSRAAPADEPDAALDPFDFADPIPIVSNLPADFYTHLSSTKWKDRKELALEPLLALLSSSPRYASDNYNDLAGALAGRMGDANVLCVILAAQCIEKLARGLRDDFARYKGGVTAPIMARTKEKKQNVLDALGAALDAVFASVRPSFSRTRRSSPSQGRLSDAPSRLQTSIGDFSEDIATYVKDKNPSVKANTLAFYTRCLCATPSPPPKADLSTLIEAFKVALTDSDAAVRAAAADALGALNKVLGERVFGALVGEMDPLRKEKVTEAAEKAVTKCRNGVTAGAKPAAPARAPAPAAAAAPPKPRGPPARLLQRPPPADKENAPPPPPPAHDEPPAPKPAARAPPARLAAKKPPAPSASAPPAAKKLAPAPARPAASGAPSSAGAPKPSEPLRYKHSQESAEGQVDSGDVFPAEIVAQLADSNWKQRLEGMDKLADWVKLDGRDADAEVIVRYLVGKKPGPKESNFQVRPLPLLVALASSSLSAASLTLILPHRSPARSLRSCSSSPSTRPGGPRRARRSRRPSCATSSATSSSRSRRARPSSPLPRSRVSGSCCRKVRPAVLPRLVLPVSLEPDPFALFSSPAAYEPMSKQKAPKTLAESYVFVEQALRDFGLAGGLAVRDLIDFLVVGLKNSNAAVRTNATKTLVTLRLFVGPSASRPLHLEAVAVPNLIPLSATDITSFLADLTPQLLSTIESDFEKVSGEAAPEPSRFGADTVVAAAPVASAAGSSAAATKSKAGAPEVDPLDDLFPRVDFDRLVSSAQCQALGDANWKVRKEAIEQIRDTLEANKRLKPSGLLDLGTPLKLRITDANKIIQLIALDVVARLATGMGRPFGEKLARMYAGPVAQVLADQKANIRAAGVTTLNAMADAAGLEPLVGSFDKPLEANNPLQRKELLAWLEERFKDYDALDGVDLAVLAAPVLPCLEDRNGEVRKSATAILPAIIAKAGYGTVMDAVSKLKPASKSTALPIVEAARSAANALDSPAAPPAAAPAARAAPPARPAVAAAAARPPPAAAAAPGPAAPAAAAPRPGLSRPAAKLLRPTPPTAPPPEEPAPSAVPARLGQPRPRPSIGGLRAAAAASASRSSSTSSVSSAKEPPFRSADPGPKLLRHRKETGSMRWTVDGTPRPDQVDWLAAQMAPQVSATLHAQLFSTDHSAERDFVAGLTAIDECARDLAGSSDAFDLGEGELRDRLVANFDLVVKYITLRIGLTSTTITVKCLDVVEHLLPILSNAGYKASDYEALPLIQCLISKVRSISLLSVETALLGS